MDYIKAFVTGGLLCAAVQILMDKTKLMPGRSWYFSVVCGSNFLRCDRLVRTDHANGRVPGQQCRCWDLGIRSGRACGMELTRMGFWGCSPADSRRVRRGYHGALIVGYLSSLICKPKMKD